MFSPTRIAKEAKLICKASGTLVQVNWSQPNGTAPAEDPTTGATAAPAEAPTPRQFTTRALVHTVSPENVTARRFIEIKAGDLIVDFVATLMQITNGGDTDFEPGEILDEYSFNAANRALESGETRGTASAIDIEAIPDPVLFTVNGKTYRQKKKISDELATAWDATVRDVPTCRTIALERA